MPDLPVSTPVDTFMQSANQAAMKTSLGLVKSDVGLSLVDNTSDATKNAAIATLQNKTLGANTKVALGSDAIGDLYYQDAVGANLARLPIGTSGQMLAVTSGKPAWVPAPVAGGGGTAAAVGGAYRTLRISTLSVSTLNVNAEAVVLNDSAFAVQIVRNFNQNVNIAVSGLGGLAQGSEASDTWYGIWVVGDGTNASAVLFPCGSALSPTPPATIGAYTFKAIVGYVRNSGPDFVQFFQMDNDVSFAPIVLLNNARPTTIEVLNAISTTTGLVAPGLPGIIPPAAIACRGNFGMNIGNLGEAAELSSNSAGFGNWRLIFSGAASGFDPDNIFSAQHFRVTLAVQQDFYWTSFSATANKIMHIVGFELP